MQSREELEKQLGREPTVDEIAQKTGLSRREVSRRWNRWWSR